MAPETRRLEKEIPIGNHDFGCPCSFSGGVGDFNDILHFERHTMVEVTKKIPVPILQINGSQLILKQWQEKIVAQQTVPAVITKKRSYVQY